MTRLRIVAEKGWEFTCITDFIKHFKLESEFEREFSDILKSVDGDVESLSFDDVLDAMLAEMDGLYYYEVYDDAYTVFKIKKVTYEEGKRVKVKFT